MWAKDYMFTGVQTITGEETAAAAVKKMVEAKTNSLIVINEKNEPIGIVSSYSLIKEIVPSYLKDDPVSSNFGAEGTFDKYAAKCKDKPIREIMNTDFHSLREEDTMIEAASYAVEATRRILPVVNKEGKLIGAITRTGIKNALFDVIFGKSRDK